MNNNKSKKEQMEEWLHRYDNDSQASDYISDPSDNFSDSSDIDVCYIYNKIVLKNIVNSNFYGFIEKYWNFSTHEWNEDLTEKYKTSFNDLVYKKEFVEYCNKYRHSCQISFENLYFMDALIYMYHYPNEFLGYAFDIKECDCSRDCLITITWYLHNIHENILKEWHDNPHQYMQDDEDINIVKNEDN